MKPSIAIVTPVHRRQIAPDEEVSLRQLRTHLGQYDRFVFAPNGLLVEGFDDFQVVRFPRRFFRGIVGYNKLMLTRRFYEAFRTYDFVLVCQLDALVFSDALPRWCDAPWDYIGAPVFHDPPANTSLLCLNGGLSLRRVATFRRVLGAGRLRQVAAVCSGVPFMERNAAVRALKRVLVTLHMVGLVNVLPWFVHRNNCHEDVVWSRFAPLFDPGFLVPPVETARQFAFEQEPARMFAQNAGVLPFGCHAWMRWDEDFWKRFLPA